MLRTLNSQKTSINGSERRYKVERRNRNEKFKCASLNVDSATKKLSRQMIPTLIDLSRGSDTFSTLNRRKRTLPRRETSIRSTTTGGWRVFQFLALTSREKPSFRRDSTIYLAAVVDLHSTPKNTVKKLNDDLALILVKTPMQAKHMLNAPSLFD